MANEKRAPVQGYAPGIPWSLHLEAYAAYCKKWAPQPALIDLEGRNCRGGFGVDELDEFVPGWRERADGVAVCEVPGKPTILDVGFKYENCTHTPTVLVGFAPNDWGARDAFVRSMFKTSDGVPEAPHG